MNNREAEEYISKISAYGSVMGLDTVRELLNRMGNPQDTLSFVHIAGTNGKGSVLAYISTILKEAGYRVGRYFSPALGEEREKIQVGGRMIGQRAYFDGLGLIKGHAEQMEAEGLRPPTLFEAETALAFWYFAERKCDIVILEAGMGGAGDATNVIRSTKAAVFTPVSYDHIGILGDTLAEIAGEKAGIIKEGAAVVTSAQKPEAMEVLQKACREKGCMLRVAGQPQKVKYGISGQRFFFCKNAYKIRLAGIWQPENACVALEVIEALREQGIPVKEDAVRRGLEETVWDGRFTVLQRKPMLIMDGAHNEDAVKRLRESLEEYFPGQRFILIMGALRDKEYDKMLAVMAPLANYIVTVTPPENPRALPAFELAGCAKAYHPCVTAADSLEEALEMAGLLAGEEYVTVAFGSLSYLGRLRKILSKKIHQTRSGKEERERKL